jgi:hypothetical protein
MFLFYLCFSFCFAKGLAYVSLGVFDECLKMPILTPSFIFVRLLALLISNVLVYFSVLLCCRSLL